MSALSKLKPRPTAKRVLSTRITSPEYRINESTQKKELLLSYADDSANHRHNVTTSDLFCYAAGENNEGELPDGLDRLAHHKFVVHLDKNEKAVGLDIIPARMYRSKVVPVSQQNIDTVKMVWELGGKVCRVIQRPAKIRPEQIIEAIRQVDKLIADGKTVAARTRLGEKARIIAFDGETMEIKIGTAGAGGRPIFDSIDTSDNE